MNETTTTTETKPKNVRQGVRVWLVVALLIAAAFYHVLAIVLCEEFGGAAAWECKLDPEFQNQHPIVCDIFG